MRRSLNFAGGFLAGLLLIPLVGLAAAVVLLLSPDGWRRSEQASLLTTTGADISRAGGAVVKVERPADVLRQDCRDLCDDLRLEDKRGQLKAMAPGRIAGSSPARIR